jgi:hypothetical protein
MKWMPGYFDLARAAVVRIVIVYGHFAVRRWLNLVDFMGILDADCDEPLSE